MVEKKPFLKYNRITINVHNNCYTTRGQQPLANGPGGLVTNDQL